MLDEAINEKLRAIVGPDRLRTTTAELYVYGSDAGIHRAMPDAVVRPMNTQEIADIVKLANEHKIPVIPRGAGTAMCGHSVPVDGGIIIDLQKMNRIKEIHVQDLYCVIEPGVVRTEMTTGGAKNAPDATTGRPLNPDDVAGAITYMVTQPPHAAVNEILLRPTEQVI